MALKSDLNILSEPWAITEDGLDAVVCLLIAAKEGEEEAFLFPMDKNSGPDLNVHNGVAIIPVRGSLYRYAYDRIKTQVQAAVKDPSVKAIVLKVNSPGGLVTGCKELADFIAATGKEKSIYAYADGLMCSAAVWIGSAAKHIAAPVTASVGSIGIRTTHVDWSKWNEKAGLDFTHLAAGKYKVLGNEDEPLGKEARGYIQTRLDHLYSIFVDSIAHNRKVDTQKALAMADGKVFLAEEAVQLGLVDKIEQDFDSYLTSILKKEKIMDLASLEKDHPDLYGQVMEKGRAEAGAETDQKIKDAVAAETKRVLDIAEPVMGKQCAGQFAKIVNSGASAEMASSLKEVFGKTEQDQAAGDDKSSRDKILEGLENAHSDGVDSYKDKEKANQKNFEDQAAEYASLVN